MCDFPGRMTKDRWRSVDTHFHDGAGRVLQSVLHIKAANDCFMTDYNLSEEWFPGAHHQKSLTLCWHSFSWLGREGIAICFADKGSHEFLNDWLQPIGGVNSQDAWPTIIDTLFTLIFIMGQGGYCNLFCQWRQPKIPLWLTTTYRRCDFPGRMTKNHWRYVDTHFAMALSAICNHSIWHSPSFTLFRLPFWCVYLLSSW